MSSSAFIQAPIGATGVQGATGPTGAGWASGQIFVAFDAGSAVIAAGSQFDVVVPYACTITGWELLANLSGSIVIDIWKDTYANFPPTLADTITNPASKPTLSAATKAVSSSMAGWTTAIAAGDILRFNVDSASTVGRVSLSIAVTR